MNHHISLYRLVFSGIVACCLLLSANAFSSPKRNTQPGEKNGFSLLSYDKTYADTLNRNKEFNHSPALAAWLSAAIPGAGQVYNRKYWKTPLVWAVIGTSVYFLWSNDRQYRDYRDAYIIRNDTLPDTVDKYIDTYEVDQLNQLQESHHRNRDLFVILTAFAYMLNIVDAAVDAHLFYFDVSDDLSWQVRPGMLMQQQKLYGNISISLKF